MRHRLSSLILSGLFVTSGACGGTSGATDGDLGVDADPGVDAGTEATCSTAADCGPDTPVCTASGACVQCETSADCSVEAPVCGNQVCQAACAGEEVAADFVSVPSDIIWVVDQSGSMNQETAYVQSKINDFVGLIGASNIDYRVVMMATPSGSNAICVPGPLAGANCGDNTNFRLVNQRVSSKDGPALAISKYALYSNFLRPDAVKHFVFVTDDNSSTTAASFTASLQNLMPAGMFSSYKVHAIYAYPLAGSGCSGAFGTGAALGTVYTTLVADSGGARGVICNDDWTQVFTDITEAVVSGSKVSCDLEIPPPPMGQTLDPTQVNVKYQMGGMAPGETLLQVQSEADCTTGGWYYDDNAAPTKITLCASTCTDIQADAAANVKVEFGCSTQIF